MSIKDKLCFVSASDAVRVAYAGIDRLQGERPEHQVAAVCILFKEFSEQLGISPSELIDRASRMANDNDTFFQRELKALRDYITQELRK